MKNKKIKIKINFNILPEIFKDFHLELEGEFEPETDKNIQTVSAELFKEALKSLDSLQTVTEKMEQENDS